MSGFSADWLSLREAADARARSARLAQQAATVAAGRAGVLVDLGTGTGGLPRDLAARLPDPRDWLLVDDTPALLVEAARLCAGRPGIASLRTQRADLASDLAAVTQEPVALVMASALLDLVSLAWIDRLVAACRAAAVPFYATLSYDGRIALDPGAVTDSLVVDLMNRHQRGDKGFGPALGPAALTTTAERFRAAGFTVETAASDWVLGSAEASLVGPLIEGWIDAALELEPEAASRLAAWRDERLRQLDSGRLDVRVGHGDLLALPG